ncbi:M28 family metallopeptidase [Halobacteriota archaeon]
MEYFRNYLEMLEILCKEPRPAGSFRISEIKDYLSYTLSKLGYDVQVQTSPFESWELIEEPRVKFLKPTEIEISCIPVVWSGSISEAEVVGKLEPAGKIKTFEAYEWDRYAVINSEGEALVYLITREDMVWAQPLDNPLQKIPYIIVDTESCKMIKSWIERNKEIEVLVSVKSMYIPDVSINNIIVSPKGKECDVLVCAHYDSMFNTVGAHDNASGTVALMDLAERFSKKDRNIRFILFDAEEWNKFGAYSYVEKLKKNNELQRIKLMVNIDSIGFGESIYLLTSTGIEEKVKEIVSNTELFKKIPIDVSSKDEFPQFDSWPFMKNGVPVIQIGTKGNPPVTVLGKGESIFHNPKDTIENIEPEMIENVVLLVEEFLENYS